MASKTEEFIPEPEAKKQSEMDQSSPEKEQIPDAAAAADNKLTIDFEQFPQIFEDLSALADKEIRTPENMALYIFKRIHDAGSMAKLLEAPQ